MYLKEKRNGILKARGCADGRKQSLYKTKDKTSAPTVSTESLFLPDVDDWKKLKQAIKYLRATKDL
jgi:hypothetical protein